MARIVKTECKRGHPLVPENFYYTGRQRYCQSCRKIRQYESSPTYRNQADIHRLSDKNPETMQAVCTICGPIAMVVKRYSKLGKPRFACRGKQRSYWKSQVRSKSGYKQAPRIRPYRKYVASQCSRCGFVPEDMIQLEVDHIDGNHKNNDPFNLQTLCANCHRLKTKLDRRHLRRSPAVLGALLP